ncbi:NUDIX domain-containing protein [Patescibacteria group bacterium AH-259-L07]|nr:NUDIX domain-containing protein [Patescibacteria group bacterium AH-259-L07]
MEKVKATCAIVINDKKEILLIKRGREPFAGHWALISGIGEIKKGFPLEKAVLGEVECDLQTLFLEPRVLFTIPVHNDEHVDKIVVFVGKVDESKVKVNPPFSLEYKWFSPVEIEKLDRLAFEHNEIIGKYLKTKID